LEPVIGGIERKKIFSKSQGKWLHPVKRGGGTRLNIEAVTALDGGTTPTNDDSETGTTLNPAYAREKSEVTREIRQENYGGRSERKKMHGVFILKVPGSPTLGGQCLWQGFRLRRGRGREGDSQETGGGHSLIFTPAPPKFFVKVPRRIYSGRPRRGSDEKRNPQSLCKKSYVKAS